MTLNQLLEMDVNEAQQFLNEFNRKFEPTEDDIRAKISTEFDQMLTDQYWEDKFNYSVHQAIIEKVRSGSIKYIREMRVNKILDELIKSKDFEDKIKERISHDVKRLVSKIITDIIQEFIGKK